MMIVTTNQRTWVVCLITAIVVVASLEVITSASLSSTTPTTTSGLRRSSSNSQVLLQHENRQHQQLRNTLRKLSSSSLPPPPPSSIENTNTTMTTGTINVTDHTSRELLFFSSSSTYRQVWTSKQLGTYRPDVTLGNPLRGLIGNGRGGVNVTSWMTSRLPGSIQICKIGLDEIMINDPDMVGTFKAFNWTVVDQLLSIAQNARQHVVLRFYVQWPGEELHVPPYLFQKPYSLETISYNGEKVPNYANIHLRKAFRVFIKEFGRRYDGDTRIYVIQLGLVGAWGEYHTLGCKNKMYNNDDCDPTYVKDEVIEWYGNAFHKTKLQVRYPKYNIAYQRYKMGYHDDAFTQGTLSGKYNGNVNRSQFFWNLATSSNTTEFWKSAIMGGEIHPANTNDIFLNNYPKNTEYHQDFLSCVQQTHTSYIAWHRGFSKNNGITDYSVEQNNARYVHARIGYNFVVEEILITKSTTTLNKLDFNVTIRQAGVAPFYYPLWLNILCDNKIQSSMYINSNKVLQNMNDKYVVTIKNGLSTNTTTTSSTNTCLSNTEIRLVSTYTYPDAPIKWAQQQGMNRGRILLNIPKP